MKIKKIVLFVAVLTILTGCGSQVPKTNQKKQSDKMLQSNTNIRKKGKSVKKSTYQVANSSKAKIKNTSKKIVGSEVKIPKDMNLYKKMEFEYDKKQWRLQIYANASVNKNGELDLDDRCKFLIRAVSKEKKYILLNQTMQLGTPQVSAFTDQNDILHIIVEKMQSASCEFIDFSYDKKKKEFKKRDICNYEGINLFGMMK